MIIGNSDVKEVWPIGSMPATLDVEGYSTGTADLWLLFTPDQPPWYPGGEYNHDAVVLTVFTIKSNTIATLPTNRDRTTLGLAEQVECWTEPSVSVHWSIEGGGSVNPEDGSSTTFTASKSPMTQTIHAEVNTTDCSLDFEVIEPSGESGTYDSTSGWTPGPPNNQIGPGQAKFICTTLSTTVNFYNVWLRENLPGDDWKWPDKTKGSRPAFVCRYKTYVISGIQNRSEDYVSEGPFPISRLNDGTSYQDHQHTIRVPLEYENEWGGWTVWFPDVTHEMQYQGSDQKSCVKFNSTNVAYSDWVGPWQ